ncbi:MAG: GAF domain-containing protein, partial [Deltaproteobacteria bacterium]|nr:GAF domain-containing protein [Deltaproteobacteria bacterium]
MSQSKTAVKSVSRRISFSFISVVTLILVFFAGVAIYSDSLKINKALEKRLENALQLSHISLPTPLWNLDNTIVDDFIEALFLDEAMVYAEVSWGQEVISKRVSERIQGKDIVYLKNSSQFIDKSSDILYEGNKVGKIMLVMSRESVKYQVAVSVMGIVALTVLLIVAIATTSFVITRTFITMPLLKLQSAASSIAQGNLDTAIEKSSRDEIGLLAQHLDDMRGAIKDLFAQVNVSKKRIEDYSRTLEHKVEIRTKELAQSVDELRALGEVSQVVSSTLDLDVVLNSIVRQSVILSESDGGTIFEFDEDEQVFVPKINYGLSQAFAEVLNATRIGKGDKTAIGQAALTLSPVQISDLKDAPQYPLTFVLNEGFRALLALPLIRENRLIGGLVILRKEVGEFSDRVVKLLQNFAAQSVLAIHNAKLYREIEEKSYQLEIADKHKSEFLANMSHELR